MKSFANCINDAAVMTAGMKNNELAASERGWKTENNNELISAYEKATALNAEQEKLKAALKMKTVELAAELQNINNLMKEASRVVKLGFPQTRWKEFGVNAKH